MNLRFAALPVALVAGPALAHHPLAGKPMETFSHGVLSGIGHPILGFDHLFFIVAIGVAALYTGRALTAPLAYVAAMVLGVAVVSAGIALPMVEPAIALSLLVLGGLVAWGRALSLPVALGLFALAGVFHGWAFGESIAGQEGGAAASVYLGYLIGLGVVQWLIAVGAGWALWRIWGATSAADAPARIAGGVVSGVGAFLVLEVAEGAIFTALGLA